MDAAQFRLAMTGALDDIVQYYDTLPTRRVVSAVEPGYLKKLLPDGPPQDGESFDAIRSDINEHIIPGLTHWQSPNFMAFFPASSTYPGILGELYSATFTAAAFNWLCSPAITELETIVLDWLADLFALPECFKSHTEGGGVIQGSASEAIVTVMVAARDRYLREKTSSLPEGQRDAAIGELRGRLIALASDQAHSSAHKAALISGTRFRTIPTYSKDNYALTGAAVKETLQQCEKEGLIPFFVEATMGTTATCAVDNFEEVVTESKAYPLIWIHVDAAYAGSALVCEEFHHISAQFAEVNSFDMNMHKWLLTNFDASCLYIRKRRDLVDALSVTPSYLRNDFSDSGSVIDYRDWQIPLGRRFRALKIWFVLRTYGVNGLKQHIRRTIGLGTKFADLVRSRKDVFRIFTPPAFALTVIQILPKAPSAASAAQAGFDEQNVDTEAINALTKQVHEYIFSSGMLFLTSTVVDGHYCIRVVSANPLSAEEYVQRAFETILEAAEKFRNE